jgi:hypothetical protein
LERELGELTSNPDKPVREATEKFERAVREYHSRKRASLWNAVSEGLREMRLGTYGTSFRARAAEFAAGIFRPDFLLKVWNAMSG